MTLLEASSLVRRYGRRTAVGPLDLALEEGRVVWLAGGNGAGKTTLLRLLATSLIPTAGTLTVAGLNAVRDRVALRGLVAIHWEGRRLYDALTCRENLELLSALERRAARGNPSPQQLARSAHGTLSAAPAVRDVHELLAMADLAHRADEPVAALSQGMRSRLEIASTLVTSPRLLLLDEPFAAIDPAHRSLVGLLVSKVTASGGSVLLTSHEARPALEIAHEVWVLKDGALAARIEDAANEDAVRNALAEAEAAA